MRDNKIVKILVSIPVILVSLYFIPFLGIVLSIFRLILFNRRKDINICIIFPIIGILLFIPKIVSSIVNRFGHTSISVIESIIGDPIYSNLMNLGKTLIILGIVLYLVSYIVKVSLGSFENKVTRFVKDYIDKEQEADREIKEKNNLKIQEKQYAHKNTHVMECSHCGHENMFVGPSTKCVFCRCEIFYKEK